MLTDVRTRHTSTWDESLKPIGEGTFDKEPFEEWWARNQSRLANLDQLVAEQWVYRHWRHSPFAHLPLERMTCREEEWITERILRDIDWGLPEWDDDPEFNHGVFHGKDSEPGRSMDATDTWNIPPVVLGAPGGLLTDTGERPERHYWLVEGRQRRRYLHALASRCEGAGRPDAVHKIIIVRIGGEPTLP
ncbi:MAG: hypothetical protein JWR00_4659 [Rubritepida sp.]|nr:hypothetical protein [Rubritepida sp.]